MEICENPKTEQEWMLLALEEARRVHSDVPVGCLIVLENVIVGRGHNQREENNDPTGHAEIIAIKEAAIRLGAWRLTGCTLISTLEPCPMCAEAAIQARIKRIVFGAYDIKSGAAGSAFNLFISGRIYPIPEVIGGIMEEECQSLLINHFHENAHRE